MTVPHVWIRHVPHLLHEACSRTGNPDPSLLRRSRLSQRGLLYQRLGDFNDGSLFRTVRRPGSPRSRCRPRRCPARTRSPVLGRRLPAAPSRGGRSWELSEVSFVRAPPSWPNHPPRPLLLMPPPWGLGFRHRVGWGIAGARCSGAHTAPPSSSPSLPACHGTAATRGLSGLGRAGPGAGRPRRPQCLPCQRLVAGCLGFRPQRGLPCPPSR